MSIMEWSYTKEAFIFAPTVIMFFIALFFSIRVFCTFMARLAIGIIKEEFEMSWGSTSIIITSLWTVFFILKYFLEFYGGQS